MVVGQTGALASVGKRPRRSVAQHARYLAARHVSGVIGAVGILLVVLVALLAGILATHSPTATDATNRLLGVGVDGHLFGTDNLGRDVFSRTVYGTRVSLIVGFGVSLVAIVAGVAFGLVAGYYRRVDSLLMRLMDALMAFPGIVLAIGIMAVLGQSLVNVIVALGIVYMPRVARLVRSVVLGLRERQFVESARALGLPDRRILVRHILPNTWSPVIVQATFIFAEGVLGEAALSFLGIGPPPTIPSWGNMLGEARQFIREAPLLMIFPGTALTLMVLSLNLVGDGIRDLLDPRLRRRL
ncbi:MAG: ABC transporter permease [Sphaerobacter sp.]|nr:ABC transporter permease [Sphaerobacter sp.]